MNIRDINIHDFRCFDEKKISFINSDDKIKNFTAIIGNNGVGKTTILEAIAKAFVPVLRTINPNVAGDFFDIKNSDIKNGKLGTAIEISITLNNKNYEWHNQRKLASGANITGVSEIKSQKQIRETLAYILNDEQGNSSIPVVLYYSINRMLISLPKRTSSKNKKIKTGKPFEALDNAFSIKNDYRRFFEWFKSEEDIELRNLRKNPQHISKQLKLVREVVSLMLNGYFDLRTEIQPVRMLITDGQGNDFDVTQLSGGYKAIFSLVTDIASRLALANPKSANPLLSEGIILIDEIDLHLHPKWQKTIVNDLKRTFPNCQFIVTTHSPFIIQSLDANEIINLEKQSEYSGKYNGWSIDEIQEYEMGVAKKTPDYIDVLKEFEDAIDSNNFKRAKELFMNLNNMLHPQSEIKKLLRLDIASLGDNENDKNQ